MNIPEKLGISDQDFRVVIGRTRIEYDPDKEEGNRNKHGYSLASAVYLLEKLLIQSSGSRPHLVKESPRSGEMRHEHLTFDDSQNIVQMVTTMRPNETVRVISFRPANEREIAVFEDFIASRLR